MLQIWPSTQLYMTFQERMQPLGDTCSDSNRRMPFKPSYALFPGAVAVRNSIHSLNILHLLHGRTGAVVWRA